MRKSIAMACVGALVAAELSAQIVGVADVPLYRPDLDYGYIPAASQDGAWLGKRWVYNERSMGVDERWRPGGVLLIGDSVVNGGNQTDQPKRLGPQLEALTGRQVWPVSAGSWALLNQLAFLRENRDLVEGSDAIVFVLNAADFGEPSVWTDAPEKPSRPPVSAILYLVDRMWLSRLDKPQEFAASGRDWWSEWSAFLRSTNKPVLVVAYPDRGKAFDVEDVGVEVVSVGRDDRWSENLYRDGIHPSDEGAAVLAQIIADALAR